MEDMMGEDIHTSNALTWNNDDVIWWLLQINFPDYRAPFREHQITGQDLFQLTETDLKVDLRVNTLHDRKALIKAISKLKEEFLGG
mmetsp:Transcript_34514/g.39099  ORF Transcript_34514/g.39099 Transcript_34514/m.39099 type:complete len:86 (+) Transcript_34514:33-290(+)